MYQLLERDLEFAAITWLYQFATLRSRTGFRRNDWSATIDTSRICHDIVGQDLRPMVLSVVLEDGKI